MHAQWGGLVPRDVLRFLHVAGVLLLMLAEGAVMAALFRVKHEKELPRIAALLDLSRSAAPVVWSALALVAATGALSASIGHTWGALWVWGSAALLLAMAVAGHVWGTIPLNAVRRAAGLAYKEGRTRKPGRAADHPSLALARHALQPWRVALVAAAAVLTILWLMLTRP
jgi:hypothetical protein